MRLGNVLTKYLRKLEKIIDPEHTDYVFGTYKKIFNFEEVNELPLIYKDPEPEAEDKDWPLFPYNEEFHDPKKMLLNQLRGVFFSTQIKDYRAPAVRCNYGTVILPSIFGGGYQLTETSMPWVQHFNSRDEIRRIIDAGVPNIKTALGKKCFDTAGYYMEELFSYPKLKEIISIYHPDLQGPFDIAHLLWGQDIFLALYDDPELVHKLLSLITETYKVFMSEWKTLVYEENDFTAHWQFYIKGSIMLRDDTAIILSRRQYEEFVKPYDDILLKEFGGCIHFCGRGDHLLPSMCKSDKLYGINSSQPELNDVQLLVNSTQDNRLTLLGFPEKFLKETIKTGIIVFR